MHVVAGRAFHAGVSRQAGIYPAGGSVVAKADTAARLHVKTDVPLWRAEPLAGLESSAGRDGIVRVRHLAIRIRHRNRMYARQGRGATAIAQALETGKLVDDRVGIVRRRFRCSARGYRPSSLTAVAGVEPVDRADCHCAVMTAQALRRRSLPGLIDDRRELGACRGRGDIPIVRLPRQFMVPQQCGRDCTMRRVTEGALADGRCGQRAGKTAREVMDCSRKARPWRLSSERPGVASGQPDYRYRGYCKNRNFSSHKPPSLRKCSLRTIFRKFLSLPRSAKNSIRKKHAVLENLKIARFFDKQSRKTRRTVPFRNGHVAPIDTL